MTIIRTSWITALLLAASPSFPSAATATPPPATPTIDAAYPGGNILVETIRGHTFHLKPDLRDTQPGQWWFYWNFRVRHAQGRTLRFQFADKNPIGTRGPAFSRDEGRTWSWLGPRVVRKIAGTNAWEFSCQFGPKDASVRFAFAMPYLQADLQRWLARHQQHPHLVVEELCRSKQGRSVERLRLGRLDGHPTYRALIRYLQANP